MKAHAWLLLRLALCLLGSLLVGIAGFTMNATAPRTSLVVGLTGWALWAVSMAGPRS